MTPRLVAGVYIERHQGTIIFALAESKHNQEDGSYEKLAVCDCLQEVWDPRDSSDALQGLTTLASHVGKRGKALASVGVASYGPFVSLNPLQVNYGVIDPERGHKPFNGQDLAAIFRSALAKARKDGSGKLVIHTDANACALGEAVARGLSRHHVLCTLLVTEGIGGGLVNGQLIAPSALHPEIGLLPLRFDRLDPLHPEAYDEAFSRSASDLADNVAMRRRASLMYDGKVRNLLAIKDGWFWQTRAYYIAQLCVAMTAMLAPHQVVILCDVERQAGDLVRQTKEKFRDFLVEFEREKNPVFSYRELKDQTFISGPTEMSDVSFSPGIAASGVLGMAYAAAWKSRPVLAVA